MYRSRYSNDFRSVQAGGHLNNGSKAGVTSRNSNNDLGNSNSNNGSQLSYSNFQKNTKPCLSAEHKKCTKGVSSNMQGLSRRIAKTKKLGRIYPMIYDKDNIRLAFKNAMKGKSKYRQVQHIKANFEHYVEDLHNILKNRGFKNGEYSLFKKTSGNKVRTVYKLPFYPDRVVHHCILQVVGYKWQKSLIYDTYSTIPGRGPHKCAKKLKDVLYNSNYHYCLKFDIKKYYPSIDNSILKKIVRKKIKDKYLLELLDEIIDSAEGVPIGNYISQWFGNLYLNPLDQFAKNKLRIKNYYRYCDDIVILGKTKTELWCWFRKLKDFLNTELNLEIKGNYQVFPISEGIDFLGFKFFKNYTLVRKRIVKALKRNLKKPESKCSYFGWLKHADSRRLIQKYFSEDYALKCLT